MELLLIWFLCAIIGGMIGVRKHAGVAGFFMGLLLGPLGLLIAIFMRGNRPECPFCKELVHPEARRCPHCQKDFAPSPER